MISSGRLFKSWGPVTGNAWLSTAWQPIVGGWKGGTTRRLVLAERRACRSGKSATWTTGSVPSRTSPGRKQPTLHIRHSRWMNQWTRIWCMQYSECYNTTTSVTLFHLLCGVDTRRAESQECNCYSISASCCWAVRPHVPEQTPEVGATFLFGETAAILRRW